MSCVILFVKWILLLYKWSKSFRWLIPCRYTDISLSVHWHFPAGNLWQGYKSRSSVHEFFYRRLRFFLSTSQRQGNWRTDRKIGLPTWNFYFSVDCRFSSVGKLTGKMVSIFSYQYFVFPCRFRTDREIFISSSESPPLLKIVFY